MEAVIKEMPAHWLEERRRSDASRWDEMWEGVLHMSPQPTGDHQDLVFELAIILREKWAIPTGGKVHLGRNVTPPASEHDWRNNYRCPDTVLMTPDRFQFDKDAYIAGPPFVCVEVRSPNDESYEKLPFYAKLGVPEVWIIDRDTKKPEVFALKGTVYESQAADTEGWIHSAAVGVKMKAENEKLLVRFGDETEAAIVPM